MRKTSKTTLSLTTKKSFNYNKLQFITKSNAPLIFFGGRSLFTAALKPRRFSAVPWLFGILGGVATSAGVLFASTQKTNWDVVRKDIKAVIDSNPKYDDGSFAPLLIRLAWHAAGTYCKQTKTGGSNGALMRFKEGSYGANAGLQVARDLLEKVKKQHPEVSYADLWTLAGCVAVEHMGGPHIPWREGRSDHPDETHTTPDGRLPDASKDRSHVRDVFNRMGFSDQEIVALLGAHAVGRCHTDRSGYDGPWTSSPTTFSNEFYTQLLEAKWSARNWKGPKQYEDETKTLMMLPTDIELTADPEMRKWVERYAKDEDEFFRDFAKAFSKLLELGVEWPKDKLENVESKSEIHQKHQEFQRTHEKKIVDEKPTSGWRTWLGGKKE